MTSFVPSSASLRFDVETISKATMRAVKLTALKLRFDVETISKATDALKKYGHGQLRFDVETISKATKQKNYDNNKCCGLM